MSPLSLVLDLSACLSVGLVDGSGRVLSFRLKEQGARGETAHGLLDECLLEAGAAIGDIASVCVGTGPGSFTGIRVCAAMAQGLAFAKRLPLHPFSSLAALTPFRDAAPDCVAAIATSGGRYFVRVSADGRETLMSAEELRALGTASTRLFTAGNFPDCGTMLPAFAAHIRYEESADFSGIARLALAGPAVLDGVLRPNYLMASAAEEKRRAGEASP